MRNARSMSDVAGNVIATNGVSHVSLSVSDSALHQPDSPTASATHEGDSTVAAAAEDVGLTIGHAAELLGVHPNTLRKRIRKGTLAALLMDGPTGREYRIAAVDVQALRPASSEAPPSLTPAAAETDSGGSTMATSVLDTQAPPASTESDTGWKLGCTPTRAGTAGTQSRVVGQFECEDREAVAARRSVHQRRAATPAQINSMMPKGHAPCKKPYRDDARQAKAKASTNNAERRSSA